MGENFYNLKSVKEYQTKAFNPNFGNKHFIEIPSRILIVGPSGSGKSNTLLNLIKRFNGTFNHIYLGLKNSNEPLYQMLIKKLGDSITVYENGEIPRLSDIQPNGEQLFIFDDLVGDKGANQIIEDYFKLGRKKNITSIYLSQSYFKTPKFIRDNLSYLIIKKITSKKELKLILNDYPITNINIDQLKNIYEKTTKKFEDCLSIDVLNHKLYYNFNKLIN
jgi:ABC-type sugar transport system ATPase subunit